MSLRSQGSTREKYKVLKRTKPFTVKVRGKEKEGRDERTEREREKKR